jgi:hypothetical protein
MYTENSTKEIGTVGSEGERKGGEFHEKGGG